MIKSYQNKDLLTIELNTAGLDQSQVRMVKTLNVVIEHVISTKYEDEYFEGSAEMIRLCASIIKQANFNTGVCPESVPYSVQALEFSLDVLNEYIEKCKVINYDC